MSDLTLGSLFDGSGGFPLAGIMNGITPLWASEIEPFPIKVTQARLPGMKHLGDITQIDGSAIDPVDIITFGSPCQDLSVAGSRAGLEGSRSGLFHEAIRIIREMREVTHGEKPRFIVWENVKGAFSSNGGEDFRMVLEEICSLSQRSASVPLPEKPKWSASGCVMADGFSVAWRVLDAQYWGVPQRRKRIFLVGDLNGQSAGEILFNAESLSGNSEKDAGERKNPSGSASNPARTAGLPCLNDQGGQRMDVSWEITGTLRARANHPPCVPAEPAQMFENHSQDARYNGPLTVSQTLSSLLGTGGNNQPLVVEPVWCASKNDFFTKAEIDLSPPLVACQAKDPPIVNTSEKRVRRLTPVECARLQGFPDWWCSDLAIPDPTEDDIRFWTEVFETHRKAMGKTARPKSENQIRKWLQNPYSDAAEYRMWGNGVALPCVAFVLSAIAAEVARHDAKP